MSTTFRIGITRDTLREDGTSIFDPRALRLFDTPRFEWEFIADNVKELTAAHAARYDALCVLNPRVTAATRLPSGVGLPGRVAAGRKPVWIMDVPRDRNFPRTGAAADLGVQSAFGFPVMLGQTVMGVMEFFSRDSLAPDPTLLKKIHTDAC